MAVASGTERIEVSGDPWTRVHFRMVVGRGRALGVARVVTQVVVRRRELLLGDERRRWWRR